MIKVQFTNHHDDLFASLMLDVANDNEEIWFKAARAIGE